MDFRRLLLATTGLTALTMLVGVYTAEFGAGLACEARWPLCDGAVYGLFPANIPSFIEWFHRLLAMVTGFFVLGTAIAAWRRGVDSAVAYGLLVALVLLPFQIVLGALTVTRYEIAILTAHFATPTLILGGVIVATVWSYRDVIGTTLPRLRQLLAVSLLGFPVLALLTPRMFFSYSWAAQMTFYTVGLAIAGVLVAVALLATETERADRSLVGVGSLAAVVIVANLVIGRLHFGDTGQLVMLGLSVVAFVLVVAAVRRVYRLEAATGATPAR